MPGIYNCCPVRPLPSALHLLTPRRVSGDVGAEYTTDRVEKLKITGRVDYGFKSAISYDGLECCQFDYPAIIWIIEWQSDIRP